MRKTLWIIAFLVLAPSVRADSFQVISGSIVITGSGSSMLSGDGWTLNLNISLPGACPQDFLPGNPIEGCGPGSIAVIGFGTLILHGITQPSIAFDSFIDISQNPLVLSGQSQATLTEPATFGELVGCFALFFDQCPPATFADFSFPPGMLNISVTKDFSGDYEVTNEVYTFTTPETSSGILLLSGFGIFALLLRKRFA